MGGAARRWLPAALLAALPLTGPGPARAAPAPAFDYAGNGCTAAQATLAIPAERARRAVPARFALALDAGAARLLLSVVDCRAMAVGSAPVARTQLAEAGVRITPPDGTPGDHYYALWQVTDVPELRARAAAVGIAGDVVAGLRLSQPAAGIGRATGSVPWPPSSYEVSADGVLPASLQVGRLTWWHAGTRGLARWQYGYGGESHLSGSGRMSAAAGSRLQEVAGARELEGAGLVSRFDFSAGMAFEAAGAGPAGTRRARPARLLLGIVPRATRVRRFTRFRFVVRTVVGGRRRPVRGAVIRFLGRRLVTNARGRATTRARFVRPGRHRVLVTRRGARSVRAVVRVFPPLPRGAGELDENERPCFAGRWPVKTASDPRARLIDPRPIPIRLTSLWRLPPPFPRVRFGTPRLPGIERHVYRMRVRLVTIQLMLDRDIHLVVAEPGRPRRTMIVEFAHPNCRHARRSRFARQFRVARTALLQACGLAKRRQRRIVGAGIVTGVGFWDTRHGQFGVARNGIELHPVTGYVSRGCRAAGPRRRR